MKQGVQGTTPAGAYSPGVVAEGRFVYVSGPGTAPRRQLVTGTIESETKLVIDNLGTVLAEAGASYDDVVRCGVFLADLDDFEAMNSVYGSFFSDPLPARTTVGAHLPDQGRDRLRRRPRSGVGRCPGSGSSG